MFNKIQLTVFTLLVFSCCVVIFPIHCDPLTPSFYCKRKDKASQSSSGCPMREAKNPPLDMSLFHFISLAGKSGTRNQCQAAVCFPNSKPKRHRRGHRQPKLCGSSLDFEFIRECMKINKIRPKFLFLTKLEIKMTYLVFLFCLLLSLCLQSHFG